MTYFNALDPRKGRAKNNNEGSGNGCIIVILVIGAIFYFPVKWCKEWTMNPLEYQIKVAVANFRNEPSMKSQIIRKAKKGQTFMMLSDTSYSKPDSLWFNGVIDGDTGWIYKELLEQDIWK